MGSLASEMLLVPHLNYSPVSKLLGTDNDLSDKTWLCSVHVCAENQYKVSASFVVLHMPANSDQKNISDLSNTCN